MYRKLILKELRDSLMRLRDPRCEDRHAKVMYLLGMLHGFRLGQVLDEREICTIQMLINSAKEHGYKKTPWPETAEYLPF